MQLQLADMKRRTSVLEGLLVQEREEKEIEKEHFTNSLKERTDEAQRLKKTLGEAIDDVQDLKVFFINF